MNKELYIYVYKTEFTKEHIHICVYLKNVTLKWAILLIIPVCISFYFFIFLKKYFCFSITVDVLYYISFRCTTK